VSIVANHLVKSEYTTEYETDEESEEEIVLLKPVFIPKYVTIKADIT
jgi:hypothetical protein